MAITIKIKIRDCFIEEKYPMDMHMAIGRRGPLYGLGAIVAGKGRQ